jgi:hypothetical protein
MIQGPPFDREAEPPARAGGLLLDQPYCPGWRRERAAGYGQLFDTRHLMDVWDNVDGGMYGLR